MTPTKTENEPRPLDTAQHDFLTARTALQEIKGRLAGRISEVVALKHAGRNLVAEYSAAEREGQLTIAGREKLKAQATRIAKQLEALVADEDALLREHEQAAELVGHRFNAWSALKPGLHLNKSREIGIRLDAPPALAHEALGDLLSDLKRLGLAAE